MTSRAAAMLIDSDGDSGVDAPQTAARPATAAVAPPRARTPPPGDEVDAVTADRLHPTHWVVVTSPDGKLKTYYNTSTLVRIAQTKGKWMQPPHFREAMTDALRNEILRIENREITVNIPLFRQAAQEAEGTWDAEVDVRGLEVAEHFVLDRRQVYVCPLCYDEARKRLVKEADDQLNEARQAAEAARGTEEEEDAATAFACMENEYARLEWRRCPLEVLSRLDPQHELPYVIFTTAVNFKAHFKNCHGDLDSDASDHTLRAMINGHLASHNQKHYEQRAFHRSNETTSRYWFAHARFNTMRYNRLRAAVDGYQPADLRTKCVFEMQHTYASDHESDFVADEDDDDDDNLHFEAPVAAPALSQSTASDLSDLSSASEPAPADGDPRSEAEVLKRLERRAKAERVLKKHRREVTPSSSSSGSSTDSSGDSTDEDDDAASSSNGSGGNFSSSSSTQASSVSTIDHRPSTSTSWQPSGTQTQRRVNQFSNYEKRKAAEIDLYLRNRDPEVYEGSPNWASRSSRSFVQTTFERGGLSRPERRAEESVVEDDEESEATLPSVQQQMLRRIREKEAARALSQQRPSRSSDASAARPQAAQGPPAPPAAVAPATPTTTMKKKPPHRPPVLIDDD